MKQAQSGGQWAGGRTGAEKVVEHMLRMQLCLQHGDWRGAQMSVSEEEKWRAASQPRGWKELEDEDKDEDAEGAAGAEAEGEEPADSRSEAPADTEGGVQRRGGAAAAQLAAGGEGIGSGQRS